MNTEKIPHFKPRLIHIAGLALVVALGFTLRIWGLTWSLPANGGFSFHPDEIFQVAAATRINILSLELNPGFYNYGTMYFYMVSFLTSLCGGFGLVIGLAESYLAARLVTAAFGTMIPFLVYLTAKRLYSRATALVAAAFASVTPVMVVHSHFATVDIPATFWVTACLAASAAIFHRSSIWMFVLAGIFAGFAGATKYGASAVIIAPFVAHLTAMPDIESKARLTVKPLIVLLAAMAAGFVIGTPGSVLWTSEFLQGFTYEMRHAQEGHGVVFEGTGAGWLYHLTSSLRFGFGVPFLALSLVGMIVMALDRNRRGWFVVIFGAIFYLIIGAAEVRFARYIIPIAPVLAIAAAVTVVKVYELLCRLRWKYLRRVCLALCSIIAIAVFYYTLGYSVALNSLFTRPDTRVTSAEWIASNAPRGSVVALPGTPWFYSPAFRPEFTRMWPSERLEAMSEVTDFRLITNGQTLWDWNLLKSVIPDYVVVSDFESLDAVRSQDDDAAEYYAILREHYEAAVVVSRHLRWGGLSYGPVMDLPHDLKYASPTLTVYRRRA